MKKITALTVLALAGTAALSAYEVLWVKTTGGVWQGMELTRAVSAVPEGDTAVKIALSDGSSVSFDRAELQGLAFGETEGVIEVEYSEGRTVVKNPLALQGVTVTVDNGNVVVSSEGSEPMDISLSGKSSGGSFKLYSSANATVTVDGLELTSTDCPALNFQTKGSVTLRLVGSSVLADAPSYTLPEGEKANGAVWSKGNLNVEGDGSLSVSGSAKHALATSGLLTVASGSVVVTASASDGLHGNGVEITGGSVTVGGTKGDGIDADAGMFRISGGKVVIESTAADVKGIKADGDIEILGGEMEISVAGDQSKGIKSKGTVTVAGGRVAAGLTGKVVITDGDPSYCTAIKTDVDFVMNGGTIEITGSGMANKGISADGNATFTAGNVTVTLSGDGTTYTDVSGVKDACSSTCITIDGDMALTGGTFELSNSGTAGKCIKVDGAAVFGSEDGGPSVTARTSGKKILVSGSSGGWGQDNGDYSNPKVVKVVGNLSVDGGTYTLTSTVDGGEALESKSTLTINGGVIDCNTYDDALNAATHIQINGGYLRACSTNNDAIDSNGTMTVAGGVVLAFSARTPEGAFDCDNNRFAITGGVMVGIGGSSSNPTTSACTQRVVKWGGQLNTQQRFTVAGPDGQCVLSVTNASAVTQPQILFSAPGLTSGTTYTIYRDGAVEGGESYAELTIGGTRSGGSQVTTFNPSSMVTSIGNSGGGPGGRP